MQLCDSKPRLCTQLQSVRKVFLQSRANLKHLEEFMTIHGMDLGHKCFSGPAPSHERLCLRSSTPTTVHLSALSRHMLDVK